MLKPGSRLVELTTAAILAGLLAVGCRGDTISAPALEASDASLASMGNATGRPSIPVGWLEQSRRLLAEFVMEQCGYPGFCGAVGEALWDGYAAADFDSILSVRVGMPENATSDCVLIRVDVEATIEYVYWLPGEEESVVAYHSMTLRDVSGEICGINFLYAREGARNARSFREAFVDLLELEAYVRFPDYEAFALDLTDDYLPVQR